LSPPFLQSKSLATARLPRTQYEHQHQHHRQRLSDCLHSLHVLLSTQNSDITYFSSLATFTKVIVTAAMDLQSPEFGFFQPLEVRLMICKSRQSPNWSRSFLNFKIDSSASRAYAMLNRTLKLCLRQYRTSTYTLRATILVQPDCSPLLNCCKESRQETIRLYMQETAGTQSIPNIPPPPNGQISTVCVQLLTRYILIRRPAETRHVPPKHSVSVERRGCTTGQIHPPLDD